MNLVRAIDTLLRGKKSNMLMNDGEACGFVTIISVTLLVTAGAPFGGSNVLPLTHCPYDWKVLSKRYSLFQVTVISSVMNAFL